MEMGMFVPAPYIVVHPLSVAVCKVVLANHENSLIS